MNFIRNSIVYKKGSEVNGIYLIEEGEFEETLEYVTDMSMPTQTPHHGKFPYFKGSFIQQNSVKTTKHRDIQHYKP